MRPEVRVPWPIVRAMSAPGPKPAAKRGRACPLCPVSSDVDLLCYCKRIVNFNSQVADGALAGVPRKQLHGSRVARASIDDGRLCSRDRMRSEQVRIYPYTGQPTG